MIVRMCIAAGLCLVVWLAGRIGTQTVETSILDPPAVVELRDSILQSELARAPIERVLQEYIAVEGPPLVPLQLALALRRDEALPLVLERLAESGPYQQRKLTKLIRYARWSQAVPSLLALATSVEEHELSRTGALYALGMIDPARAAPEILPLLANRNRSAAETRVILTLLARARYQPAAPQIRPFLTDPDSYLQLTAMWALAELGEPVDASLAFDALTHADYGIRREACGVLSAIDDSRATAALRAVESDDTNAAVRATAKIARVHRATADLDDQERAAAMRHLLSASSKAVRNWAIDTLAVECGSAGWAVLRDTASAATPAGVRSAYKLVMLSGPVDSDPAKGE